MANCKWCGAPLGEVRPGRPRRYCSHAHRSRSWDWKRLVGEPVSLAALAARDGYRCGICSELVDLTAVGAAGPSIDHVLPVAAGGTHDLANLQVAHQACNNRKRDRPGFAGPPLAGAPAVPPLTLF